MDQDLYDTTTRQLELNEYSYKNKMDTLFFFQMVLFSILILCLFAYGVRMGFFSNAMFIFIALILLTIDILIFVVRYTYSTNIRDQSSWDRRRFAYQAPPPAAVPYDFSSYMFDISGVHIGGLCTVPAGYNLVKSSS